MKTNKKPPLQIELARASSVCTAVHLCTEAHVESQKQIPNRTRKSFVSLYGCLQILTCTLALETKSKNFKSVSQEPVSSRTMFLSLAHCAFVENQYRNLESRAIKFIL